MLTPMIAAVIMRVLVSREGLRHSLGPLRCWRYYVLAAITPAIFVTIVLLVDVLTGLGTLHARHPGAAVDGMPVEFDQRGHYRCGLRLW
jgi:hypothetical protein